MQFFIRLTAVTLFATALSITHLTGQSFPPIGVDCANESSLTGQPFISDPLFPDIRTDCVPNDRNGESTLTYTFFNTLAIGALRGSTTNGDCFFVQWEVTGGSIVFPNGQTSSEYCEGEATTLGLQNCSLCASGLGQGLTYGFANSSLSSTVRVRWNPDPGTGVEPKVKVKLVYEAKDKVDLGKFKTGLGVLKLSIGAKEKLIFCEREMKLRSPLYEVDDITSTYSCTSDRRTFRIEDSPIYSGCLSFNPTFAYQSQINGGAWSSIQFTNSGTFSVGGVKEYDRVTVRVSPALYNQWRGNTVTHRSSPANAINLNMSSTVCGNYGFIRPWWVTGLSNVSWSFSSGFPTSSVSIGSGGGTLNFTGPIPSGRYAVRITGRTALCNEYYSVRRYFTVKDCDGVGGPGGDDPVPFTYSPEWLDQDDASTSDEELTDQSVSSPAPSLTHRTMSAKAHTQTNGPSGSQLVRFSPNPVSVRQMLTVQRVDDTFTSDGISLQLIDINGRVLHTDRIYPGQMNAELSPTDITPGTYILRVQLEDHGRTETHRFVVQ